MSRPRVSVECSYVDIRTHMYVHAYTKYVPTPGRAKAHGQSSNGVLCFMVHVVRINGLWWMPLLVDYVGCLEFYSLWFSIIVAFQCYIILRILTLHTVTIMVTLLRKAGGE